MKKFLTGQKVPDLLDQISQILIAPVHFFFGSIGFQQNILSILFRLISPQFCFRDLYMGSKIRMEQCHSNDPENDDEKLYLESWVLEMSRIQPYYCVDKVISISVPIQRSYIARASIYNFFPQLFFSLFLRFQAQLK